MDVNLTPAPGSHAEPGGVRFALYSEPAEQVELCLFDSADHLAESRRIALDRAEGGLWTVFVPGEKAGCLYGYRVHGPFDPTRGFLCNPNKIVIDPYARALGRAPQWDGRLFGHSRLDPTRPDPHDSAPVAPLARVVGSDFDWEDDAPPAVPWEQTVIYETHVKSLTARHPAIPQNLRGGFSALASPTVIGHLQDLGVTAVELLPVHQAFDEWHCVKNHLVNYWGYNTLLPFAPDVRFARLLPNDPVTEFKMMVKTLHRAGLEVLLDVVYNHTAEGGVFGPTLSFRGIDNTAYYRRDPRNPEAYQDVTGCGNSWNMDHPQARRLVLDSLRYWVSEMHVDGFRFDLATVLGRGEAGFNARHPFFTEIQSDPVLSRIKLIAEPWDLGEGGYQLAGFPDGWSEWNDQYRNVIRRFWRGDSGSLGLFARRIAGSEDIFGPAKKPPRTSINYVTCHDGFTLQDWVSYNSKHNRDNREDNRDGNDHNFSLNHGEEGPSLDKKILETRYRQKRNLLTTLFVSQGTPMLLGGDELGRTQRGNNNAWCQDNAINWYHWGLDADQEKFQAFVKKLIRFRKTHPGLSRLHFFTGKPQPGGWRDLTWHHPEGREMKTGDWSRNSLNTVGMQVMEVRDSSPSALLFLFHAEGKSAIKFILPKAPFGKHWRTLIDTVDPESPQSPGEAFTLHPRSMAILEPEGDG